MKIFIMRHGEASHMASSDAERHLTMRGRLESLSVVKDVFDHKLTVDKVLVSPYIRAGETWEEISSHISCSNVEKCEDVTPYGQADKVYDYVMALIETENLESVFIVSHLPLVGYMASEFITDMAPPMFPTSGLVCIEFDPETETGQLLFKHHP
ncbi:phosphohistidine phosphatase SixA [Vibrio salinus]|uniref:phosphohistidine phosphatase SixA n=1 Tax=Vibrio salinus TaxID=2899784 RepID=UPI001E44E5B6|nr:phosphohistidine phosphatase SixA [Vibrio salinus]MCE0494569.1 phosphohistidine phosphatase SixA [Vibrio salinus]